MRRLDHDVFRLDIICDRCGREAEAKALSIQGSRKNGVIQAGPPAGWRIAIILRGGDMAVDADYHEGDRKTRKVRPLAEVETAIDFRFHGQTASPIDLCPSCANAFKRFFDGKERMLEAEAAWEHDIDTAAEEEPVGATNAPLELPIPSSPEELANRFLARQRGRLR